MTTKTDRELLAAWRETGDESAFAELVARHRQMVYRTSLRMLGNVHDTEDAVQAVFVVLAQKADRLQREGSLGGWLHTVTRHVAMQALARRASHARREKEFAMSPEADIETSSPDVNTSAVLRCLDQELAGLSAVLRQAVVLRYLQGNSEKAAAEQAGCPLGTLSWRASKGLAKLRARLAKRGVALGGVALAGLLASEASAAVPETLLPSILAAVKTAVATTATATGATSTAAMLAKGAMKAMYIAQVKMVAAVAAAVVVTGTAVPVGIAVAQAVSKEAEASHTATNAPVVVASKAAAASSSVDTAETILAGYPAAVRADSRAITSANELMQKRMYKDAIRILEPLVVKQGDADAGQELRLIAECYYMLKEYSNARTFFLRALPYQKAPNGKSSCEERLAVVDYRLGDLSGSNERIGNFLRLYPSDERVGTLLSIRIRIIQESRIPVAEKIRQLEQEYAQIANDKNRFGYYNYILAAQALGELYISSGNDPKAIALYVQTANELKATISKLPVDKVGNDLQQGVDAMSMQVARYYFDRKEYSESQKWLETITFDPELKSQAKHLLARLLDQKDNLTK
ncbi:MAG: sigma-70 family RNA polymerase sigma factor [Kiritimatiellia bacterium]